MKKNENFASALANLKDAPNQDLSNDFVQSGLINKFALQFELSWKLLKRLLEFEGDPISASGSPRDIIKAAFKIYDFLDEDVWLDLLRDRNTIVRIYDGDRAAELVGRILSAYLPAFEALDEGLSVRYGDSLFHPDNEFF